MPINGLSQFYPSIIYIIFLSKIAPDLIGALLDLAATPSLIKFSQIFLYSIILKNRFNNLTYEYSRLPLTAAQNAHERSAVA